MSNNWNQRKKVESIRFAEALIFCPFVFHVGRIDLASSHHSSCHRQTIESIQPTSSSTPGQSCMIYVCRHYHGDRSRPTFFPTSRYIVFPSNRIRWFTPRSNVGKMQCETSIQVSVKRIGSNGGRP